MFKKSAIFFAVLVCSLPIAVLSQSDEASIPDLRARVTDTTGTLSASEISSLEGLLQNYEKIKGIQIAVLLVPTTMPEAIEQYSMRVVEKWKLGRRSVDDGVLILIAKNDRKLRIEVGYGLEGTLSDLQSKRIIDRLMVPHLKNNSYHDAIKSGIEGVVAVTRNEQLPEPTTSPTKKKIDKGLNFPAVLVTAIILGGLLKYILGRILGGAIGGGIAFLGTIFITGSIALALFLAFVALFFIMASGRRGGPGWIGHGGGFGGGFGGGSFGGGFGGGGGSFGGGGASGSW